MTQANLRMSTAPILFVLSLASCGGGSGGDLAAVPVGLASPPPTVTPTATATATPSPTYTSSGTISGGEGNDIIYGTESNDTILGKGGNDILFGLGGDDLLDGGLGSDVMNGGAGNDTLIGYQSGQSADDTLTGDAGADTFYFSAHVTTLIRGFTPSISATISDFQTGLDRLRLRLTGISTNDDALHWLEDQPFTGQNRLEVRLVEGILQIDDDGDRIPELQIRIVGSIKPSDIDYEFDPFGY